VGRRFSLNSIKEAVLRDTETRLEIGKSNLVEVSPRYSSRPQAQVIVGNQMERVVKIGGLVGE